MRQLGGSLEAANPCRQRVKREEAIMHTGLEWKRAWGGMIRIMKEVLHFGKLHIDF
jgi:hypothetical protein